MSYNACAGYVGPTSRRRVKSLWYLDAAENQQRGLFHAHILVGMPGPSYTAEEIDTFVMARIPSEAEDQFWLEKGYDVKLSDLVRALMTHSCNSYCLRKGKCRYVRHPNKLTSCRFPHSYILINTSLVFYFALVHDT